ncbi:MAG: HAD family hydrolase [Lachnospiraceae bacterium]|nr:HAD family hydrolase [Lachnospiraceae bacterium]
MRISFDLDEVLFVDPESFETEKPPAFPLDRIFPERLRKGTVGLIHQLQEEGFEVWVYTSSYRSELYIRSLFRQYGVTFDHIINAPRHLREVQRKRRLPLPQKVPTFYRIDLHIDDEDVIHRYGREMGFKTLKVCDPDPQWDQKVLDEARRLRAAKEKLTQP